MAWIPQAVDEALEGMEKRTRYLAYLFSIDYPPIRGELEQAGRITTQKASESRKGSRGMAGAALPATSAKGPSTDESTALKECRGGLRDVNTSLRELLDVIRQEAELSYL
jgi:hypothetical protein